MAKPRPSYLKRQKEQQRQAKAAAKREARRVRRQARDAGDPETEEPLAELESSGLEETGPEDAPAE